MYVLQTKSFFLHHISVNASKVKYAMSETKDEEPLVTNNSVINATIYVKLFERSKTS